MYLHLTWQDPGTGDDKSYHGPLPVTFGRSFANPIVLNSSAVSRQHGRLDYTDNQLWLTDLDSANGIWLDGQRIQRVALPRGSSFRAGPFVLTAILTDDEPSTAHSAESALTISLDREAFMEAMMQDSAETAVLTGDDLALWNEAVTAFKEQPEVKVEIEPKQRPLPPFPPPFFNQKQVALADVQASGIAVDETTYLTLGGGLGSFVWVDYLRICGVPSTQIVAVGVEAEPHGRYRRLCQLSQIPDHERLRSDSGSTADNIWGWPGYALREVWQLLRRGHMKQAARIAYQIFGEPTLIESYTPRAGDVYASIEREAARIGWDKMWRYGRLRAIRQTDDGRYIVATSQTSRDKGRQHRFIIAPYLHLAVGYPGVRFLPDLQTYRTESGDFQSVVNAYEDHEHIYQQVQANGGTVLLRGRGIVASRILQRLYEARQHNANITVLHLMRSPNPEGTVYGSNQRLVENHWEMQPFNWPKAMFGGSLRTLLEAADDEGRDRLLNDLGGTTTADRRDWRNIVSTGLNEGWYQIRFGQVAAVQKEENGRLDTTIHERSHDQPAHILADFIIDATGLNARIENHPLLKDLLDLYDLPRNPKGNLAVSNAFEVTGLRNGNGRVYAAGAMTLGGPFAPVDSFVGLQYAAQKALADLHAQHAPAVQPINGMYSLRQWLRWAKGTAP